MSHCGKKPLTFTAFTDQKIHTFQPGFIVPTITVFFLSTHLHKLHQWLTIMGNTGLIINKDESNDGAPEFI